MASIKTVAAHLVCAVALIAAVSCTEQTKNTYDKQSDLNSQDTMKKSKILMVFTSHGVKGADGESVDRTGYTLAEAAEPWVAFSQAGYMVDFITVDGAAAVVDSIDLGTEANRNFWNNAEVQAKLRTPGKPKDVKLDDYMAIFFVGGHGTMWDFPEDEDLIKLTADIYDKKGGIVGAVCHGPAALINVKLSNGNYLIKGKKVAAFTNAEEKAHGMDKVVPFLLETKLKQQGANVIIAPVDSVNVQVADRLVTGQNKPSARKTADEVLRLLKEIATR